MNHKLKRKVNIGPKKLFYQYKNNKSQVTIFYVMGQNKKVTKREREREREQLLVTVVPRLSLAL